MMVSNHTFELFFFCDFVVLKTDNRIIFKQIIFLSFILDNVKDICKKLEEQLGNMVEYEEEEVKIDETVRIFFKLIFNYILLVLLSN